MKRIDKFKEMDIQEMSEWLAEYVAGVLFMVTEKLGVSFTDDEKRGYIEDLTKGNYEYLDYDLN